jgi:hypothetical protein
MCARLDSATKPGTLTECDIRRLRDSIKVDVDTDHQVGDHQVGDELPDEMYTPVLLMRLGSMSPAHVLATGKQSRPEENKTKAYM